MSGQDNSLSLDSGRAEAVAFTDGRYCKRVEISATEIYFCYRKYDPNSTDEPTLTDGMWQVIKSDGAGGYAFPQKEISPGSGTFTWDPGYHFNADDPAGLTFFEL